MKDNFARYIPVNTRIRIASLWTAVMFCFIYGDFFSLFVPGRLDNLNSGNSGVGTTTPVQLLLFALLMTPAILMVHLSLVLKVSVCRVVNICAGLFYALLMTLVVVTSFGRWMLFYSYFGALEILLTLVIVKLSWTGLRKAE